MRRAVLVGALLVGWAGVAGCGAEGGNGGLTATTVATSTTAATPAPTRPDLNPGLALLTLGDLPDGYAVARTPAPDSLPFTGLDGATCRETTLAAPARRADVHFHGDRGDVEHTVAQYAPGDARVIIDNYAAFVRSCRTLVTGTLSPSLSLAISALPLPALAEQMVAFRTVSTFPGMAPTSNTVVIDTVVLRRGDVLSIVSRSGGVADADPALDERLARAADQKLAGLLR